MNIERLSTAIDLVILPGASRRVERLVANVVVLGRGWSAAPPPIRLVAWTITWLVVGGLVRLGARLGVAPPVDGLLELMGVRGLAA